MISQFMVVVLSVTTTYALFLSSFFFLENRNIWPRLCMFNLALEREFWTAVFISMCSKTKPWNGCVMCHSCTTSEGTTSHRGIIHSDDTTTLYHNDPSELLNLLKCAVMILKTHIRIGYFSMNWWVWSYCNSKFFRSWDICFLFFQK